MSTSTPSKNAKLAEALRANLKKRKQQQQARKPVPTPAASKSGQ